MFSIFKRTPKIPKDYFPFTTDIHSHILPGIDDGSPDIETSILLIKGLMKLGIKKSVATPHVISDMYRNTPSTIANSLLMLKKELQHQGIDFELTAAAEYMMDTYFFELLKSGEPLLTISENYILTEFSYVSPPDEIEKISFEIITAGYKPILAHPERYAFFNTNLSIYNKLSSLGFLLQVNLLSLAGFYGKDCKKAAQYILDNNLAAFTATDLHHVRHLELLNQKRSRVEFHKYLSHRKWNDFYR